LAEPDNTRRESKYVENVDFGECCDDNRLVYDAWLVFLACGDVNAIFYHGMSQ